MKQTQRLAWANSCGLACTQSTSTAQPTQTAQGGVIAISRFRGLGRKPIGPVHPRSTVRRARTERPVPTVRRSKRISGRFSSGTPITPAEGTHGATLVGGSPMRERWSGKRRFGPMLSSSLVPWAWSTSCSSLDSLGGNWMWPSSQGRLSIVWSTPGDLATPGGSVCGVSTGLGLSSA